MNPDKLKIGKMYASKSYICSYDHPKPTNGWRAPAQDIPANIPFVLLNYSKAIYKSTLLDVELILDDELIDAKLLTTNGEVRYARLDAKLMFLVTQP